MRETDGTAPLSTDDRIAQYDDAQAATRAMLALDAGRMGSWRWDIEGGTVTGDPFVATLLHLDFDAQPWPVEDVFASMHPDDLPRVQAEVDKALSGADIYEVEFRDTAVNPVTGTGGLRWLGARGSVTRRGANREPLEMIGVNWDATEQKTQEERLSMLAGEMDHRVKNAFAVIRALINLGQRSPGDKKTFAETLKAQIQAMADAHAISARLARQTQVPAVPVPVAEVIEAALTPWMAAKGGTGRSDIEIALEVDDTVAVEPVNVSAIAMLIYELATNAAKYGPLGEHGGSLSVALTRVDDGRAEMRWIERTDNPALREKVREEAEEGVEPGFGSILIQHCVATLSARVKRDLTPEGLHFDIQFPIGPSAG